MNSKAVCVAQAVPSRSIPLPFLNFGRVGSERVCKALRILSGFRLRTQTPAKRLNFDGTIVKAYGGYSSAAERLTVAQDVVGSIPTSRPNGSKRLRA